MGRLSSSPNAAMASCKHGPSNHSERLLAFSYATELLSDPCCVWKDYVRVRMENQASKSMFANALRFFPLALHLKESFLESQGWTVKWGNRGSVPMLVFIFETAILVLCVVSQVKQEKCSLLCCTQLWQIDVVCPGRKEMLVQKLFPISLRGTSHIIFSLDS